MCSVFLLLYTSHNQSCFIQPLATDIPTAASLGLRTSAVEGPNDPPLPQLKPTESKLVRDEWMLLPPSAPVVPAASSSSRLAMPTGNESLTEEYGDSNENGRTMSGGVDFFSSLGTEKRKKPIGNKVDEKVRSTVLSVWVTKLITSSRRSARRSSTTIWFREYL